MRRGQTATGSRESPEFIGNSRKGGERFVLIVACFSLVNPQQVLPSAIVSVESNALRDLIA